MKWLTIWVANLLSKIANYLHKPSLPVEIPVSINDDVIYGEILECEDGHPLFVLGTEGEFVYCCQSWRWYNLNTKQWEQAWADQVIILPKEAALSMRVEARYQKLESEIS